MKGGQIGIDKRFVGAVAFALEVRLHLVTVTKIGKTQTDRAQGIVQALLFRALDGVRQTGRIIRGNAFIKKLHIGIQRGLVVTLFEVCPAEFVQCLLMEGRSFPPGVDDCLVSTLGLRVVASDKQVLAAAELGFVVFVTHFILFRITGECLH